MRRKILSLLLTTIIIFTLFFAFIPTAFAAGVTFDVNANPKQYLKAGTANVTFSVTADGVNISNVKVYKGGSQIGEFGSVNSEQKQDTASVSVSEAEIDAKKLSFEVKYTQDGEAKSQTASVSISRKAPTVSIEKSYKVDRKYGPEGTRIGIVFFIKNTGGKTISDVKVKDDALNGGAWMGGITIEPGETRMITSKHTINKKETIKPQLSYSDGSKTYESSFGSNELYVSKGDVTVELEADKITAVAGEEVTLKVKLRNESNVYLSKLKLFDHNNVEVPLKGSILRQGDAVTATIVTTFRESATIQFDITAEDSYHSVYSYASNKIEISVPIEFNPDDLTITAETEYSTLAEAGPATFSVLLSNHSFYGLYDLKIIDNTTDVVLAEISHLEKGERFVRVKPIIESSKDMSFRVEAQDAAGYTHEASTVDAPISISLLSDDVEAPEPTPTLTPSPTPTPSQTTFGVIGNMSLWVLLLIVVGVLILGIIIALSAVIASAKKESSGSASDPQSPKEPKRAKTKKRKVTKAPKSAKPQQPVRNVVPKKRPGAPKKKKKSNIKVTYRK